jgi:hypothetical protein
MNEQKETDVNQKLSLLKNEGFHRMNSNQRRIMNTECVQILSSFGISIIAM